MGMFPIIQSPCPYKGPLSDIVDGDICRLCKREVHDLSLLSDSERYSLVQACPEEICVSYRVPRMSAIAALALGAATFGTPAFGQDADATSSERVAEEYGANDDMVIIVGGLRKPYQAQWESNEVVPVGHQLPIIFDDEPTSANVEATPATTALQE